MQGESYETRDEKISEAIEAEIQAKMHPDARPIDVAVQGANVTLTGHVANQATKDAIIKMARGTDGVINVTDDLVIGGGHPYLDWFFPWRNQNKDLEEGEKGDW
ncbi:MAG: hypothetical protein JWO42_3755 [Chloroflexi bacterium]|jgi:osmotically-inducible protein OsmY|nr:hypothetical protein [Chloroflexota bacterium]